MYTSPIENWDASLLIEKGKLKVVVEQGLFYLPSDITFRNWTIKSKTQKKKELYTQHTAEGGGLCVRIIRGVGNSKFGCTKILEILPAFAGFLRV